MLPHSMWLNKAVEEQLIGLRGRTGITPNVASRIAFFRSVEAGFTYDKTSNHKLTGSLKLDKFTWLGKTELVTELLLKQRYPDFTEKELQAAWAAHVENGIASLRNHRNLSSFSSKI